MPKLLLLLAAVLGFAAFASTAQALETGTAAWTLRAIPIFEGPGRDYQQTGALDGQIRIRVDRCQMLWCQVRAQGQKGWAFLHDLGFGREPLSSFRLPPPTYPSGGPGQVCFYDGANYTGDAYCAGPGKKVKDLLLFDMDNRFSSVSIDGDVSVDACRDRFFHSYCERIIASQPHLNGFLANNVSSFQVY